MHRNLRPNDAQLQCDLAGDPHSHARAAKAAMQRATWGRTGRIAIERQCADSITATHRLVREAQAACNRPLRGKNFQK